MSRRLAAVLVGGMLIGAQRRRRIAGALGSIVALAVAIGVVVGASHPGSSRGASTPAKGLGSATVQRRDLVATDTQSGTLGYAKPSTVFNRLSGTITALAPVGALVEPGQALYQVDGSPVVLFDGTTPAYRTLSAGIGDGGDVQELKQNLVILGFDPSHQITINQTFDAATTAAVDRWQASLGETQTGTVTLGQVVFLPGPQRVTTVDAALGSTGGSGASGSSSAAGSGSGAPGSATGTSGNASPSTASPAGAISTVPQPEFVSLTTTTTTTTSTAVSAHAVADTRTPCTAPSATVSPGPATKPGQASKPSCTATKPGGLPSLALKALVALLKAETLELRQGRTSFSSGAGSGRASSGGSASAGSGRASGAASGSAAGGRGGGGAAGTSASGAGAGGSTASGSAGSGTAASAQAIMQTTSNQLVVTVNLDATKQSEAVLHEPVSVQLPSGGLVNGRITQVSPVAQTSSSSSGSSGSGSSAAGSGSSAPSATIPVTIALTGHGSVAGLDQAAVSVNFEQQSAKNVLSVPVTALLATAGGGYSVQQATPPHRLIPVTPGLFATGYVQISGTGIYPGLQVTDSQG